MFEEIKKVIQPKLEPGTTVATVALVVDQHGRLWWIDPENMKIKPAVVEPE